MGMQPVYFLQQASVLRLTARAFKSRFLLLEVRRILPLEFTYLSAQLSFACLSPRGMVAMGV